MALTWATGVHFRHATRRNDRENELHLSTNAYGSLGHRSGPKTLISMSYLSFYVFSVFYAFCFWACVWPMTFLWPISNLCLYLYVALVIWMVRNQFRIYSFFTSNSLQSGLNFGGLEKIITGIHIINVIFSSLS
ncbi:hypothetical protein Hanom_Chr14g01296101 [Helianthus anomalus]